MKFTICFLFVFLTTFSVFSQDNTEGKSIQIGAIFQPEFLFSDYTTTNTILSYGFGAKIRLTKKYFLQTDLLYSRRNFQTSRVDGLVFGSDIINGTTAFFEVRLAETSFEWIQQFQYLITEKGKFKSFVGGGFCVQTPLNFNGERKVEHSDGMIENLMEPTISKNNLNFGLIISWSAQIALGNNWNLQTALGFKNYFQSNISKYRFPQNELEEENTGYWSVLLNVGVSYQISSQ